MDFFTVAIVLLAAIIHAFWNLNTKKTKMDKLSLLWLSHIQITLFCSPLLIYALMEVDMDGPVAYYLVLTGIFHAAYIVLLGKSYNIGEVSFVYPISRGLGIVGTSLLATMMSVDHLNDYGIYGVCIITLGVFIIGNASGHPRRHDAFVIAACVGICTAFYSIVDKMAVLLISSWLYCALTFSSTALCLSIYIAIFKPRLIKSLTWPHLKGSSSLALMMFSAYSLILYAFQGSPASYVVALRESSIAIAALLGVVVLKERNSIYKVLGVIVLLSGIVIIKIGN